MTVTATQADRQAGQRAGGTTPTATTGRVPIESGVLRLDAPFALEHGGSIPDCDVAWELTGSDNAPLVVALGGISAGRNVTARDSGERPTAELRAWARAGWWQDIAGEGRALDTRGLRVLGIDWLGGAGASSGPSTLKPCPTIDTKDQARAVAAVLDHLGVARAKAIIGASYGGMVALAFAALFPRRLERAVIFSAAHRSHPMATALRSLQRRVVRLGIETGREPDALCIARGLAMTTYRTAHEFAERFPTAPRRLEPVIQFPVEDYLDHCGSRFAESFSPEAFLRLSESIDLHDIEPERIDVDITLAVVDHDPLVPVWQVRELAARLGTGAAEPGGAVRRHARVIEIDSIYGHDAFLKEVAMVSSVIAEALDAEGGR